MSGSGTEGASRRGVPDQGDTMNARRASGALPLALFVCVHNAGRSQMAEALFNALAAGRAAGESAGTTPAERPHPEVVDALREIGLDIADARPRMLTMDMLDRADRVITMGCGVEEACPGAVIEAEDWGLPDPKGQPIETVRTIRDDIRQRVIALLDEMGALA